MKIAPHPEKPYLHVVQLQGEETVTVEAFIAFAYRNRAVNETGLIWVSCNSGLPMSYLVQYLQKMNRMLCLLISGDKWLHEKEKAVA
jgi:hypothetical protein